jgi:hypothetical protein
MFPPSCRDRILGGVLLRLNSFFLGGFVFAFLTSLDELGDENIA